METKENLPAKLPSLVDLHRDHRELLDEMLSAEQEGTPEQIVAYEKTCSMLCAKTDAYAVISDRLEEEEGFWKAQRDACAKVVKTVQGVHQRLKDRMKFVLEQTEGRELQGNFFRYFLTDQGKTFEIDEEALPKEFKKTVIELKPDKEKIKAALASGAIIQGVVERPIVSLRRGRRKV